MKINNDELERVLLARQLQQPRASGLKSSDGQGFEGILAKQMGESTASGASSASLGLEALAGSARLASLNLAVMSGSESLDANGDDASLALLDENLAGLLDGLDGYAQNLGGTASVKDAWSALSGLDQSLAEARQTLGRLSKPDPTLESMVKELEILSATEKFKINRGDYLG